MSTTETSLSRIPFRLEDERMIASMARWMRFIATITIVGGFLMILLTLTGTIVVSYALRTGTIHLGKIEPLIRANPVVFGSLGFFSLITAVMTIVAGFALHQAGEDFDHVARTDTADQDYVADGLAKLKSYFKVIVVVQIASMFVAMAAAASLAAKIVESGMLPKP